MVNVWRARKHKQHVKAFKCKRAVLETSKVLHAMRNRRRYLRERAIDFTDISRTQEIVRDGVCNVECLLNGQLVPEVTHVLHAVDVRELETCLRTAASQVILYGLLPFLHATYSTHFKITLISLIFYFTNFTLNDAPHEFLFC